MISRTFVAALLAGGCLSAAGGGAYLAVRQNAVESTTPPAENVRPADQPVSGTPVTDTEAVVDQDGAAQALVEARAAPPAAPRRVEPPAPEPQPRPRRQTRPDPVREAARTPVTEPLPPVEAAVTAPVAAAVATAEIVPDPEPLTTAPAPESVDRPEPAPVAPEFEEVVIPASAVIGLQVETTLSSERSRVEDRVDARVTRDVMAEGRVAIPAGSRVIGHVTLVEPGGKLRERARLGIRFHTVVLAGGLNVPLRTETIIRESESLSGKSARKIGGAAAGGAILGAILGGGKGAAIGGAAGAGAGTAAVMAGDRTAAALPAGTTLTARLSDPVIIELER